MKFLKHNRQTLPASFEYHLLLDAIFICLNSEQALIVQIALCFLTVNFSFLPCKTLLLDRVRLELWGYIKQGGRFLGLFLHWSPYVRISFYRFLFYSLIYLHSKKAGAEVEADLEALEQNYKNIGLEGHSYLDDKEMVVKSASQVNRHLLRGQESAR